MRILVLEDEDSIRRMISALVQARGFEVVGVASGVKALDDLPPREVILAQ